MKSSNFRTLLYGILFAAAFACSKKDDPAPQVSSVEGKAIVSSTGTQIDASTLEFNNSQGVKAAGALGGLGIGVYAPGNPLDASSASDLRKANQHSLAANLSKHLPASYIRNIFTTIDPDFSNAKGIYEYNFSTKSFDKTGTSDKIVINFPYPTTLGFNNSVYTISNYKTILVNKKFEPTNVVADLSISGVNVLNLAASFSYDSEGEFTNVAIDYTLGDKAIKVKADKGTTVSTFSVGFYKNSTIVFGYDATVTFATSDQTDLNKVDFSYVLVDLTFKGSMDIKGFINAATSAGSNMTQDQINALIDKYIVMQLLKTSNNAKIADVKLREINGQTTFVIVYNDGSQGDFAPVINALTKAALKFDFGDNL